MTNNLDLTIIAIAVAVMAIMVIVILFLLIRLLLHLLALERSVVEELKSLRTDVRDMVQHVRHTSDRVTETIGTISRTATWVGRMAKVMTSLSRSRHQDYPQQKLSTSSPDPSWWLTGLKWGWSLISRRHTTKPKPPSKGAPPAM